MIELGKKKEKLKRIIGEFHKSDISDKIVVWNESVKTYSQGDKEIEDKAYNLLKMLNEAKQTSEEEYQKLMKRDIETDLWYML